MKNLDSRFRGNDREKMKRFRIARIFWIGLLILSACGGGKDKSPPVTAADPPGGSYRQALEVTLESSEPATIYYTLNGAEPAPGLGATKSGESPVTGIAISADTTLKFFGVDRRENQEKIKTEIYYIDSTAPQALQATASGSGTASPDAGDTVTIGFSEPVLDPQITADNINSVMSLNQGHSWLDGAGKIGGAVLNSDQTALVITLSAEGSPPTVASGDTITFDGTTVTDRAGNPVAGSVVITGVFGQDSSAPASRITFPSAGSFVGKSVEAAGTADDDSAEVARVDFSSDGGQTWAGAVRRETGGEGDFPWSYSWSPAAEGETSLCSRATDPAGNQETPPFCLTVTADLTPPAVQVLSPGADQYLNSHTPIPVSGTASDNLSGVALVEVSSDEGLTYLPADGAEAWSYLWSPPAGDGNYIILARARDRVGNIGLPAPDLSIYVDNTPPFSWIVNPTKAQFVSGTVILKIQAMDSGSGIARVEVKIGSGSWVEAKASTGEWTCAWDSRQVLDGNYTVRSRATDRAGNQEIPGSGVTFSVENIPPVSTILTPAPDQLLGITTTPISGTASDSGSGVAKVEVSTDGGYSWKTATGKESWSYLWDTSGAGAFWGDRIIVSRATDKAGNVEEPPYPQVRVILDAAAPTVTITSPPDQSFLNYPGGTSMAITLQAQDVGTGMNYAEIRIVKDPYVVDWTPALYRISNPSGGTYRATYFWNPIPGDDGAYTITSRAWDLINNSGYSNPIIVNLDRTPPTVTPISPVSGEACVRTGSNVRVQFSEEIIGSPDSCGVFQNGVTSTSPGFHFTRTVFPNDTLTIVPFESQPQNLLADLAKYVVRISGPITDLAGNPLSPNPSTFNFFTRDTTAPVVVSKWPDSNRLVRAEYFRGVTVTFNKRMDTSRGGISISDQNGIPLMPNLQVGDSSAYFGSLSWTGSKTIAFAMGTSSTVRPGTGYLISFSSLSDQSACGSDTQNNSPASVEWPVVTRGMSKDPTAPVLVSSRPENGQSAPPVLFDSTGNSVLLVFNEPLDPQTLVPDNFQVKLNGSSIGFGVGYRIGVDPPGMGVLIRPDILPLGTSPLQVDILTGIKDSAGNPLAASIPLSFPISGSNPGPPALTASQPAAGADFYTESFQGVAGFNREITTFVLSPANVQIKDNATGIPVRGLNFDGLSLDRPGQVSLRIRGGTRTPALKTDTEYRLELRDMKDLYGNTLSPNPSSFTFRTRPTGENRRPIFADAFGRAGYAEVFTNGNTHLHFELEVSDPDRDLVVSWAEGPGGVQRPLALSGSSQYVYSTPVSMTVPDSIDEGLSYQGDIPFTFYATDTTYTISTLRNIYFYPDPAVPNPISPGGGQTTGLTPTLTWSIPDLSPTDYLQVKILLAFYAVDPIYFQPLAMPTPRYMDMEIYAAMLSPGTTSHVVPAGILDPDLDLNFYLDTYLDPYFGAYLGLYSIQYYYCWQITAVRTGPGGDDTGHGTGFRSMSNWPSPTGSSCFKVSP
ncbi:MAG: Ig-like domain-containing protein [bacterium]|nr:Ig-like domain-containing protein [bacterium]